jgi:hypothetical protein
MKLDVGNKHLLLHRIESIYITPLFSKILIKVVPVKQACQTQTTLGAARATKNAEGAAKIQKFP